MRDRKQITGVGVLVVNTALLWVFLRWLWTAENLTGNGQMAVTFLAFLVLAPIWAAGAYLLRQNAARKS